MQKDTIKLLRECNVGCKMAVNSMKQISEYVTDPDFKSLIEKSIDQHEDIEDKTSLKLAGIESEEKEPGAMASAFSWFSTEMKMMMKGTDGEAAKILMDGCNMGIKSIGEKKNQYKEADEETIKIASDIIEMEEKLMKALEAYL